MNAKAHLRWCHCWFWWDTAAIIYVHGMDFLHKLIVTLYVIWMILVRFQITLKTLSSKKNNLGNSLILQYLHLLGNPCLFSPVEKSPPQEMVGTLIRAWQIWFFCQGGTPTESMSRKAMMEVMTMVTRGTICGKLSEPCWFYGFRKYHWKIDHKNLGS